MKQRAYIGLGANEGDVAATIESAIDALRSLQDSDICAVSPWYRSDALDAEGDEFTNVVVGLDTSIEPYDLLLSLLDIELRLGRRRRGADSQLKQARKVDLDLLLYGKLLLRSTPLSVPHPRMHMRAFVLRPLLDLDSKIVIPGRGPAAQFLGQVRQQRAERIETPATQASRANPS